MLKKLTSAGPGVLVTAAFVGPGTVTTCTLAGANYGYALLWALVFATAATIVMQEMSARLGLVTRRGLGATLNRIFSESSLRWPLYTLIGVAIFVGNSAYEGGNISGAALGLTAVFGNHKTAYVASVASISIAAAALLWLGSYKILERVLLALVCLMAIAFIATVLVVKPDFAAVLKGLVVNIPGGSLTTIIALIGTTVVPYNLFLHSSAITSRWSNTSDLPEARFDTIFTIGVGGLITILIVTTAAGVLFGSGISVANAGDMAKQLEPLFGPFAQYMMGLGLFSAGLSSAIAAPLATAFIISETWGLSFQASSWQFRMLALSVVIVGALASLTGIKPLVIIISAQFANGLLLPIMAVFLLYIMNKKEVLGEYCNGWKTNILGASVVLVTTFLGLWSIARATGVVNS